MKILMVCLGNICRSPMAEGLMLSKIIKYKLEADVDSAGFESFHLGDTPDYRAIEVMDNHGIDISSHRMRLFKAADFDRFDKIYVMDRTNYLDVKSVARAPKDLEKVDYILNEIRPGSDDKVPDPYYGGVDGFNKVYKMLDEATEVIAKKILNHNP